MGGAPAAAAENADHLLRALGGRFGPARLDSSYAELRPRFARGALVPSRLEKDSGAWTSIRDADRMLEIAGGYEGTGYRLAVRPDAPPPRLAGDYRRVNHLRTLAESEYEWRVRDELALGPMRTADMGRALTTIFRALERHDERAIRAAYRAGLPRATAAAGRLFTLDSMRVEPTAEGATEVTLALSMQVDRARGEFPSWAKYLDKYVSPMTFRLSVTDLTGARWWEARGEEERVRLRFRVRGGSLAPLDGPPRRIPDSLRARIDFSAKAMLFRVGVKRLAGDVVVWRGPAESGWTARFRREPEWQLPPLTERMLRGPLRRPFEGEGASLTYLLRDGADGAGTVAVREYRIAVRESAIVRFFGRLGNAALSDFRRGAEREADRFIGELWGALRTDLAALLTAS
jgi:hypothetical protein